MRAREDAMAGEPEDEARWLRPPEPGEVRIHIAVGEGAELTPEVRRAIDELGRALQAEEVEGFAKPKGQRCNLVVCPKETRSCPHDSKCPDWSVFCGPRIIGPCARFGSCTLSP